jgi:hypothetical protein
MSSINLGVFVRNLGTLVLLGAFAAATAYAFVHPEPCVHMAHGIVCR